ncbi:MAG: ABC transporter permease, partial [Pseudomonadota bacterium]
LLSAAPDVWDTVAEGQGVLISEQLAYRFDLGPGDRIAVPSEIGLWTVPVAGIYPDYGNPRGQVRVNVGQLTERWPSVERLAFGLLTEEGARQVLLARFTETFDLGPNKIQDQTGIRALSLRIFDRTFIVTGALNSLTLGVAGIALLTSLVTLAGLRLPQLAPVWAIGVTRRTLALTELAKMMALAMVTALAALPLGLGIAWLLLSVINVAAFGWKLPLFLFPLDWALLFCLALATAVLASLLPILRLARMAPARLIAVFAAAR